MDILKVLATRNNAFGETVVSSIFNYLLDPYADHGFGSAFLVQYLKALSERVGFLDNELFRCLDACQLADDPEVLVSAEWGQESAQKGRRIDSVVRIVSGQKLYLIATEVKIFERSSSDETQLKAYVDMLKEERALILNNLEENRQYSPSDIHCILAYLIPGDSRKGLSYAEVATKDCHANKIEGTVVVPWADSKEIQAYSGIRTSKSMERILYDLLQENYLGETSPADQGALDIVRSLRNVALKNFNYQYLASASRNGQYPDDTIYRDSLADDQRALFECFVSAAENVLEVKRVVANPLHTSIGIPKSPNPEKNKNNSLCRILTVESYKTGVPLHCFVLQITKKYFELKLTNVEDAVNAFPVKARLVGIHDNEEKLFHENGKMNEPVYRITFNPNPGEVEGRRKEVISAFEKLISVLKESYQG